MSDSVDRARLLIQHRRLKDAEKQLRLALIDNPGDPETHMLLGRVLADREDFKQAIQHARTAVANAPDSAFTHLILAEILSDANRTRQALEVVNTSISIDPENADAWALLSAINLKRDKYADALEATNRALVIDPDHVPAQNIRSVVLVNLGKGDEASATISGALARDPHNATTHANMGWAKLHAGDHKQALIHFKEAMRIDPNHQWARAGIVEALKARNPVYRIFLAYLLFMSRLTGRGQWFVIIGLWILARVVGSLAGQYPQYAMVLYGVIYLYVLLALFTWIAMPVFNLLLMLNPHGRCALSEDQRRGATVLGLTFLIATGLAVTAILTSNITFWFGVIGALAFTIPVGAVFGVKPGRHRRIVGIYALTMALLGISALTLDLLGEPGSGLVAIVFLVGCLFATWVSNIASAIGRRAAHANA